MALTLRRAVAPALGVTVVAFAGGSSIVNVVLLYGRPARWICLFVLLALALAVAATEPAREPPSAFLGLAAGLTALALVSVLWSVDPLLTFYRAGTFAVLMTTAAAFLWATRGRPDSARGLLVGLLAGIAAVAIAGLVVLAFAHEKAIQPATFEYPARFRGFEQNPNGTAMLSALGTPVAAMFALEARSALTRASLLALLAVFAGSLAASGSRGAMIAAAAGALVLVMGSGDARRRRLALAAVTVATFAACVGLSQIPEPKSPSARSERAPAAQARNVGRPLSSSVRPVRRTLLGSGGRLEAWRGALDQAAERPVAGYGFGTEQLAFVDRYVAFDSELPENSFIGGTLQLGVAGLLLLLAVFALPLTWFVKSCRALPAATRGLAAGCAGAAVTALALGVSQSYLFSVGNVATVGAWISVFLLFALTRTASAQQADR